MDSSVFASAAILIAGIIGFCMLFQSPFLGLGLLAFMGLIAYKVVKSKE